MKKSFITLTITFLVACSAFAQSVTISPSNAAIIEANATNKGILIPRMTTAQRNAIFPPAAVTGLMVYDTDLKDLYIYNGFWKRATIGEVPISLSGSADNLGILNGSNSATFGTGLQGDASSGTGVLGITDSGVGVRATATGSGIAGRFLAASGNGISAVNTSNIQATARISNTIVGATALEVTGKMTLQTDIDGSAISVTNTNTGVGSIGVKGTSASGLAVYGESQTGRGVNGVSNSGIGVAAFSTSNQAVYGNNNSDLNPTARFDNQASGGNALHVQGGIKVSGSSPAALRIETNSNVFSMPIPTTSANAQTDLIFITRATGLSGGANTSFYAKWNGSDWEIRQEDNGTITAGTSLNVLVIKQ